MHWILQKQLKIILIPTILSRGKSYYRENRILDIWFQDDEIKTYIDGTEIYIVELKASILSSKNKQRFYEFINN